MVMRFSQIIGLALLLMVCGCSKSRDDIAADMTQTLEQMSNTLGTVKDEASAKSAAIKMKEHCSRWQDLSAQADKVGAATGSEAEEIKSKYGPRMAVAVKSMMRDMLRISLHPNLSGPINDAMKDFSPPR